MIKAILIDIDATILDFDGYVKESLRDGFEKFGLRAYEPWMYDTFEVENEKLWRQIEQGTLDLEGLKKIRFRNVFRALDIDFDGVTFEHYFRECLHESGIPMPGAKEMLDYLQGKYILCTASNGPYEQQRNRLRIADFEKYFTYHFISEKIGVSKPAELFYERSFAILNEGQRAAGLPEICPEEMLMLGDSLTSDMTGGIRSGMKTCFYDRKHRGNAGDLKVDYIIEDLTDVKEFL